MSLIKRNNTKKEDIVNNIFNNIGISFIYSLKITDDLINILVSNLFLHKSLKIKNFGKFVLIFKKERTGRDPISKKIYQISGRNIISFHASEYLKKKINNVKKKH